MRYKTYKKRNVLHTPTTQQDLKIKRYIEKITRLLIYYLFAFHTYLLTYPQNKNFRNHYQINIHISDCINFTAILRIERVNINVLHYF